MSRSFDTGSIARTQQYTQPLQIGNKKITNPNKIRTMNAIHMKGYGQTQGALSMKRTNDALGQNPNILVKQSSINERTFDNFFGEVAKIAQQNNQKVIKDILSAFKKEGGALSMKALHKHVKAPKQVIKAALEHLKASGAVEVHPHGDLYTPMRKQSNAAFKNTLLKSTQRFAKGAPVPTPKVPSNFKSTFVDAPPIKGTQSNNPYKTELTPRSQYPESPIKKPVPPQVQTPQNILGRKGQTNTNSEAYQQALKRYNERMAQINQQMQEARGRMTKTSSENKGVYLPEKKIERLKATEEGKKKLRAAERKKAKATKAGEQYSSHGLAAGTSLQKKASNCNTSHKKVLKKVKKKMIKKASIEYRGRTFPGYNKPIASDRKNKKKMVLVKRGDKVKLVHFGQKGYEDFTQHKDKKRRKNYLTRSAGIKNKSGQLTKNDPFSPNYWARRELW